MRTRTKQKVVIHHCERVRRVYLHVGFPELGRRRAERVRRQTGRRCGRTGRLSIAQGRVIDQYLQTGGR